MSEPMSIAQKFQNLDSTVENIDNMEKGDSAILEYDEGDVHHKVYGEVTQGCLDEEKKFASTTMESFELENEDDEVKSSFQYIWDQGEIGEKIRQSNGSFYQLK